MFKHFQHNLFLFINCPVFSHISIWNSYFYCLIIYRFKENGLINKLRAQIREQMITALKDNPTWDSNKINITSPKIQAINLLVAEFLVYQDNLFTLSVFITEVPFNFNIFN